MIHETKLLDLLSGLPEDSFDGTVFRGTRLGLDPVAPSTNGGRWAVKIGGPILYCSLSRECALAEITFHWGQLSPRPCKPVAIHGLKVVAGRILRLLMTDMPSLGIDPNRYSEMNYAATEIVGEAAAFLGYDGLRAPSARWVSDNLMLFPNNLSDKATIDRISTEEISNWEKWAVDNNILNAI